MIKNIDKSNRSTLSAASDKSAWLHLLKRTRHEPHLFLPGLVAFINGWWHKIKFRLLGKQIKIGKAFRVYGTFRIIGPGQVEIGDDCFVNSILFKPVAFMVIHKSAKISIGNHVGFSGTTIQCFTNISINNWCNIADAYIVDSSAHVLSADRRFVNSLEVPAAPVYLEENVWISSRVVITKGLKICKNSVVGACSLVRHDIPANSFYAGNPLRFIKHIPESVTDPNVHRGGTSF